MRQVFKIRIKREMFSPALPERKRAKGEEGAKR